MTTVSDSGAISGLEQTDKATMSAASDETVPLYVDLDGSLVRTDILVEAVFALLKLNPFYVFLLPVWLLRGKANLKHKVAERVELDVTLLPYHEAFLEYLGRQKAQGRTLVLATASNEKYARGIAEHLGLFADVLASDDKNNLSGRHKLARMIEQCSGGTFDYAANAKVDVDIWRKARRAILVSPEPGVQSAAARCAEVGEVFPCEPMQLRTYLRAIRLHQWTKNILVFLPLLAAHKMGDLGLLVQALMAFFAFGLCASSVYLLNDLVDLPVDRKHPRKRLRPFASGSLSVKHGLLIIPLLLIAAFGIAAFLPVEFFIVLSGYYVLTITYSFWLKRVVLVDVLVLASLYTVRVIGGAAAVSVMPSFWLLAFSMFLFLSLAMVKRCSELLELRANASADSRGRGYDDVDLDTLFSLGSSAGYMAVLVLALYINSSDVIAMYERPEAIWLLCPLLLYWISRVWVAVRRGKMHDDPVVFAIRDRVSQLVGLLSAVVLLFAV